MPKIDKIEFDKRIRIVQEWIIDDWRPVDIIKQIELKWGLQDRQAKKYISLARSQFNEDEDTRVEQKRRFKVDSLRKLKRSLKDQFKGTPAGIRAIMAVEKQIIKLEGLEPPANIRIAGPNGEPLTIPEVKIYNCAPPLANSESEIDE